MKTKRIMSILSLMVILISAVAVSADESLYSVSSREMGITQFDFTVTEINREPRISKLKIPGFLDRSAGASRWMMCAYTDLAIKRGFKFWAALYPENSSDEVQLGFPNSANEDLSKSLGPKFTEDSVVVSAVTSFAALCGMPVPDQSSTTPPLPDRSASNIATESVLSDGMKIFASTPNGKILIKGKNGFTRVYSGDSWSKTSTLIPRPTRWYGSLGLYDPADSSTMHGRLLVDEGRQFFSSESEALRYMQSLSGYYGNLTYNNRGLVIAYKVIDIEGGEPTRSLTLWQFYIDGKKPTTLRGAVDKNVKIEGGTIPETATPFPAKIGYERALGNSEYNATN